MTDDRDQDRRFWDRFDESYEIERAEIDTAEWMLGRLFWLAGMPLLSASGLLLENLELLPFGGLRLFEHLCWVLVALWAAAVTFVWAVGAIAYWWDREGFWDLFVRTTPSLLVRGDRPRIRLFSAKKLAIPGWIAMVLVAALVGRPTLAVASAVTFLCILTTNRVEAILVRRKLAELDQ